MINILSNTQHSESNGVENAGAGKKSRPEKGFAAGMYPTETRIQPPQRYNNYSGREAGLQEAMKPILSANQTFV